MRRNLSTPEAREYWDSVDEATNNPLELRRRKEWEMTNFVPCETVAARSIHLRKLSDEETPCYTGNSNDSKTLCGVRVGWDVIFSRTATCRSCIEEREATE